MLKMLIDFATFVSPLEKEYILRKKVPFISLFVFCSWDWHTELLTYICSCWMSRVKTIGVKFFPK